jgi:hypothetical protein
MLAEKLTHNQLTLPDAICAQFSNIRYFEVSVENEHIILKPMYEQLFDNIQQKMELIGISDQDIIDAVKWARQHS